MTREELLKELRNALDSVDITFPFRYVFVEAIEALQQPSLHEGLDEAAKNYSLEKYGKTLLEPVEDFKAGVEWMAGLGYSQKTCVYFNRFNDETEAVIHLGRDGERGGFQPGDDVIVQIRRVNEKGEVI